MVISINHCAISTCSSGVHSYLLSIRNAVVVVISNNVVSYNLCRFYNTMNMKILINRGIPKKLEGDLSHFSYIN